MIPIPGVDEAIGSGASGSVLGILIALLVATIGGLAVIFRAGRLQPGGRTLPPPPPRPDTSDLERETIIADHEAGKTDHEVAEAIKGEKGSENPHGLADLINRGKPMVLFWILCGLWAAGPAEGVQPLPGAEDFVWALPAHPTTVSGECPVAVDLVVGQPLPPGLLGEDGLVRCYAAVVPTSRMAHYILVHAWATRAWPRGAILTLELTWERERVAQLSAPLPWGQRPGTQRNLGRAETVLVMVAALGIYAALDRGVINPAQQGR